MSLVVAGGAVLLSSALVAAELSLEPCINGGVSATGLYASQPLEDAAHVAITQTWELEPCIDGGVSASGLYASQTEEDLAKDVIADATAD
jgi:hypothetical protein